MSKVVVGLSGGVDSAVAAMLLREQGHDVTAVFMKNWDEDDDGDYCAAADDLIDAQRIADRLDIELQTVSFSAEYWNKVFACFLSECAAGRTPSPDIICNREIKFRAFLDYALELGAGYIATGHYAQVQHGAETLLKTAVDTHKDQTYFLHTLDEEQLLRSLFPLGQLRKPAVRELAARAGFEVSDKKDSTGICFIGERRFRDFLAGYLERRRGEIRTLDEEVVGEHDGVAFYTIGQRQGLGIGGRNMSGGEPWYVADKDVAMNVLYVVQGADHPALFRSALAADQLHWIGGTAPAAEFSCQARIRHQQPLQTCAVTLGKDSSCTVQFASAQRAVAPGQSVVFYHDDTCLGGGIIQTGLS